jgi:outer membrane protein assembly factor BamB
MKTVPFFSVAPFALALAFLAIQGDSLSGKQDPVFPVSEVRSNGLAVQWRSQLQVDPYSGRIVDIAMHVHSTQAVSYYEILYSGVRELIGFDDVNSRGIPYGAEGAEKKANLRKEILEQEGWKNIIVRLITVPQITIYSLSSRGEVHAVDGETGKTLWKVRVGNPDHPAVGVDANDKRVVAVVGPRVFCLDARDGHEIWNLKTKSAPGGGVCVTSHFAYVTAISGALELYPLDTEQDNGRPVKYFASSGTATEDATVSATSISWTTRKGYFNIAGNNTDGKLLFRLKTGDSFVASGVAAAGYFIAPSVNGKVYAVNEEKGKIAWEIALGEPVDRTPVYIGDNRIVVITQLDNLMIIDARRGELASDWPRSVGNIREFVGMSEKVLYFLDAGNQLVGIDRASGSRVMATSVGDKSRVLANNETDRLYLADETGQMVCLRELAALNPYVHGEKPASESEAINPFEAAETTAEPEAESKPAETVPDDPFSSGDNDKPPADSDDPFSNDDNDKPADSSDDKSGDDPFSDDNDSSGDDNSSGGDDPFSDG